MYVFKSYIIDDVVEAHRVNVRLEPNIDSPILGQLKHNKKIKTKPYPKNNKWLEVYELENICF